jgi:hypothetical protein
MHPIKALLGATWVMLYISTIENIYIPFVITHVSKGLISFYGSSITLLLVSLPERLLQIIAIRYFYKNDEFIEAIRGEKKYSIIFAISNFVMCLAEMFIAYVYYVYFDKYTFAIQIIFSCALFALMLSFYVAEFGFIYIIVKKFANGVKIRDEKHKRQAAINIKIINDRNQAILEEVCNMLEIKKDTDRAIDILKEHLYTGKKQEA